MNPNPFFATSYVLGHTKIRFISNPLYHQDLSVGVYVYSLPLHGKQYHMVLNTLVIQDTLIPNTLGSTTPQPSPDNSCILAFTIIIIIFFFAP